MTEAANAATLTAGTVAVDVPPIAGNYVTGAWHFYDFLSGDHDSSRLRDRLPRPATSPLTSSGMTLMPWGCTPACKPG